MKLLLTKNKRIANWRDLGLPYKKYPFSICTLFLFLLFHPVAQSANGKGVTWGKWSHDDTLGVDYVNCTSGGIACNAYTGETSCSSKLPILCLKKEGLPNPGVYVPPVSPGVMPPIYYYGWTGGHIKLSCPVEGNALKGVEDANDICEYQFGTGYKMAEHHDGNGGWGWYAYGNIDDSTRFWVDVNDQPSSCWGSGPGVSSNRTDEQIKLLDDCFLGNAVELVDFSAKPASNNGLHLTWQLGYVAHSAGFHLWRAVIEGGQCWNKKEDYQQVTRLTEELIETQEMKNIYTFEDQSVKHTKKMKYCYGLEEVDFGGYSTFYLLDPDDQGWIRFSN